MSGDSRNDGYPFAEIERKWQKYWRDHKTFHVEEDENVPPEKRKYVLDMFPYPSAAGLHVGHPEGYTATDIYCRYLRMNGYAVLHPMGFDSFGLPAENYAIKTGRHPRDITEENIATFRRQIQSLGLSYDWDREVSTHTPQYFRWTQWIFLQLHKQGLAYQASAPVWYCPALGTVLANEEVLQTEDGPRSSIGEHPVDRVPLKQWLLRITAYADRLLEGLDRLDWPESIKAMQRNWIGKSVGATIRFPLSYSAANDATREPSEALTVEVYTTRPDTLFGATYVILAPEHRLLEKICSPDRRERVRAYVEKARGKSDLQRSDLNREKTGVFTGAYAINPANNEKLPIWTADYVLISYGAGAIMAVPAHDQRDFEFAIRYRLPIRSIYAVTDESGNQSLPPLPYTGDGVMINSGEFTGLSAADGKKKITAWLEREGIGEAATRYKMRDWIFSRQRYWGEPIPLVHGPDGTVAPLDEEDLPLCLPETTNYTPAANAESPLAAASDWVSTEFPDGSGTMGKRETNTMPQWAGSCWYYLRYIDPHNTSELASRKKIDYWMPVDLYVGGAEHAVLHLLYARFWHKALYDIGVVSDDEPFARLVNQGMILGENGVKMSKSLGNVVNPDDMVRQYGADSLRLYEMFMGPLRMQKPWSTRGLVGIYRFLNRVWRVGTRELTNEQPPLATLKILHKTIKRVTEDTEELRFNTAIAQMMTFVNECYSSELLYRDIWEPFTLLISPYAPHLGEEMWRRMGHTSSLAYEPWPRWDEAMIADDTVTIVAQVNGKIRARFAVESGADRAKLEELAYREEAIQRRIEGREVVKCVVVPDKLVNIVTR